MPNQKNTTVEVGLTGFGVAVADRCVIFHINEMYGNFGIVQSC